MTYDLNSLAESMGFVLSYDDDDYNVLFSIDKRETLQRYFVPRPMRRGASVYCYGYVGIALKRLGIGANSKYEYLACDIQNINELHLRYAEITSQDLARSFLLRAWSYLETLPQTTTDLLRFANDEHHWIGRYLISYEDSHILVFRKLLEAYYRLK